MSGFVGIEYVPDGSSEVFLVRQQQIIFSASPNVLCDASVPSLLRGIKARHALYWQPAIEIPLRLKWLRMTFGRGSSVPDDLITVGGSIWKFWKYVPECHVGAQNFKPL
jgi:hypothetical protein